MTNAPGPYVDDYDRLQALGERIQIERLGDVGDLLASMEGEDASV